MDWFSLVYSGAGYTSSALRVASIVETAEMKREAGVREAEEDEDSKRE